MTGLLSLDPSQIHTVSPSIYLFPSSSFCSDRTWRSEILSTPSVLSVVIQAGFLPLVKRPEKYAFIERIQRKCAANILSLARRRKKVAGNHGYPAAPWRAVQDERKFLGRHGSGHCQQPQYVPTPISMCWSYLLSNSKRVINTHSETTAGRALFRDGMRQRRCLIPASNYVNGSATTAAR